MPSKVILIDASPRRANDGVAESVRLAGGGGQFPYYYNGQHYRAGVVQLPTIVTAITFDGGDFGAGGVPQAAELQWAASRKADLAAIANYFWIDAPITVRIGDENSVGTLPAVTITGKVLSATVDGGVVKLQLSDPAADLKKPLLTSRFGGTGGVDGPVEWDGRIKPRVWGRVWNLEGERIDPANNVYCFADPARPIQSFDALRDKGAPAAAINVLAWQGSVAATFTALQAAVAPQGGGVACPSIACVKWWTQPAGALTADLKGEIGAGYVETTAQIVQRLVQAGPNTPFAAGTIAAAQAARPAPVGWVAQDDSTGTASMIEELLGNSSLLWLLNASGEIVIREWAWGAGVASGVSQSVKRTSVIAPVGTRKLGFKRNETQMARGDLAAVVLVDGVTYSDGTPLTTVLTNVANTAAAADDKADQALAEIAAIGDPVDAISADLTNGSVQLFAYANGGVVSYAAATGEFKVFSGQTDISANFALSTQANPQALTMAYAGRTYSVTAGFDASEDTATVTIRATGSGAYAGVVLDKVLSLSKAKGGYEIVAALPSTNLFSGRVVFNEVDDKLYRYTGTAWTAAVPAADVAGQLVDTQIQAVSASKIAGLLANSQIEAVAAAKVTGQLSDAQLAAISAAKLTGQIVGTQITDGAVTTAKVAAGAITAGQIAADTITAANIAAGAVTASELAAGSVIAGKVAAGAISATELAANSVVAGKIAANAVSANEIAANAVRVQHLLVAPNNLHPDPQFRDLTAWLVIDNASTVSSDLVAPATGWYTEEVATNAYGAAANAAVGNRYIVLWSGRSGMNNVNNRYHCYAKDQEKNNRFRVVPSTVYEFKCGCQNASNQTAWVTIQWFNVSNTYVGGDHSIGFAPGEIATKAIQVSPPANASYGRIVVYNEGNNTLSGAQFVSNVSVREAAGATMVVDGSIVAGKIAANAITADKIEAGAITAAKVAASNVITLSAQINDAIITNAKIGDLQVTTLKIAGNAVTVGVSAYAGSGGPSVPTSGAWVDATSVTISTSGGPVSIFSQASITSATETYFLVRLLRNGTELRRVGPATVFYYRHDDPVLLHLDTPGAGTHTYTIQVALAYGTEAATQTARFLYALETKR